MIKKIYANGCSWTAGDGVEEDPIFGPCAPWEVPGRVQDYAWPAYLGKIMDVQVDNDAWGGGSNQRILRRLVEYTRVLPVEERKETLIIVGWTSPERGELFFDERTASNPDGWYRFNASQEFSGYLQGLPDDKVRAIDRYQKIYVSDVYNDRGVIQLLFHQIYLAKNLLENLGIPFLFFAGLAAYQHMCSDETVWKSVVGNNVLDLRYFSFRQFLNDNNIPLGPSIHPLPGGHEAWAKHLYTVLLERNIIS